MDTLKLEQRKVRSPSVDERMIEEADDRLRGMMKDNNPMPAPDLSEINLLMAELNQAHVDLAQAHTDLQAEFDAHGHLQSEINNLEADMAKRPTVYQGITLKTAPKMVAKAFTLTTAGVATFNLTDDNTATGNALFSNVYKEAANFWVDDANNTYQPGGWSLSVNKKVLTINLNRSSSTLLSLLGVNVLGAPAAAPVGTVLNATFWGD